ncbi:MAG: hypothetical protein SD837_21585 [Candidatus Electrothrix scaldis]|nr:MAG: hypothetical protein SD837_21585 [Candidatus Electrothrix sp. GW3-3]
MNDENKPKTQTKSGIVRWIDSDDVKFSREGDWFTVDSNGNVKAVKFSNSDDWASYEPSAAKKKVALSLIFLRKTHYYNQHLKIFLVIFSGIFCFLSWQFAQVDLSSLSIVLLALSSLLIIREQLIAYRIRRGLFGTNRTEARALIEFIIKNSEDIDFTDSNGNLRRALLPEAEPASTEQPLPAFGEEAPA